MRQLALFDRDVKAPFIVSYGMGVDSTAMLVKLQRDGIRPDAILFADTGAEKPQTYAYGRDVMTPWLQSVGFPPITTVSYLPKNFKNWPPYRSLEENCLTNSTLPSLAFGFKSCSQKWKIQPQDKWVAAMPEAQAAWFAGLKVCKAIGYDAGPKDIRRRNHAGSLEDARFSYRYPLIEWGWDRARCQREIAAAGLDVPDKSACYFCPATQPEELHAMPAHLLRRIIVIESRAKPKLDRVEGLWRTGTRKRPGSMTSYIRERGLLPHGEVEAIVRATPTGPIHAGDIADWQSFLAAKASGHCDACTGCSAVALPS